MINLIRGNFYYINSIIYAFVCCARLIKSRYIFMVKKKIVGCSGIPDNPALTPITDKLSEIKRTGSTVNITPGNFKIYVYEYIIKRKTWREVPSRVLIQNLFIAFLKLHAAINKLAAIISFYQ